MTIGTDFTINYPEEMSLAIFAQSDVKTLGLCSQVDKNWNRLTSDDNLWRAISQKFFPDIDIPTDCKNIKEFLGKFVFSQSEGEVLDRLDEFLQKVQLNQPASFTCILCQTRNPIFTVALSYTDYDNAPKTDFVRKYFLAKKIDENQINKDTSIFITRSTKKNYYVKNELRWKISVSPNNKLKEKVLRKITKRVKELDKEVKNS